MDASFSENPDDDMDKILLQFYEKLASEELDQKPKSISLIESASHSKNIFKANKKDMKLHKTIEEIYQDDRDTKKKLRLKNKRRKLSSFEPECEKFSNSRSKYIDLVLKKDENVFNDAQTEKSYLCCKPDENGNLLVALFPNTKIFIVGNYKLKLILGNISVLGYTFRENEEHVIFSPPTHGILSIDTHEGCQIKMFDKERIKELDIPYEWIQDFNITKEAFVVIVKLSRYESNMTKMVEEMNIRRKEENSFDVCIWKEILEVQIIEDIHNCELRLQKEPEEWSPFMDQVHSYLTSNTKKIFVICGGKSVGKSTFLKYMTNKFLSSLGCSRIACIDLDPGQPEFSLPGCLTLSVCNVPLLGPSFSHRENMKYIYQKQMLLGEVSVAECFRDYLKIASCLFSDFQRNYSSLPLLINTMGFTATCGFDIMIDILRMIEPSHVISILSPANNKNYPVTLSSDIISNINRGLRIERRRLDYILTEFKTVAKESSSTTSRLSRERNIMAYLSKLWKSKEKHFTRHTLNEPLKINWSRVAIHLFRPPLHSPVLNAINSSLVALCALEEFFLSKVDTRQPLRIKYNTSWYLHCRCLGWGVVCGIDPITKEIHIYTPLEKERIRDVNLIAQPNVTLSKGFKILLSSDNFSSMKKHEKGKSFG